MVCVFDLQYKIDNEFNKVILSPLVN